MTFISISILGPFIQDIRLRANRFGGESWNLISHMGPSNQNNNQGLQRTTPNPPFTILNDSSPPVFHGGLVVMVSLSAWLNSQWLNSWITPRITQLKVISSLEIELWWQRKLLIKMYLLLLWRVHGTAPTQVHYPDHLIWMWIGTPSAYFEEKQSKARETVCK